VALLPSLSLGAEEELKTFRGGKFSVLMPKRVKTKTPSVKTPVGEMKTTTLEGQVGETGYVVVYVDFPEAVLKFLDRQDLLDGAGKGVVESFKGKLLDEKKITLGKAGHPGRELLVQAPDDRVWIRLRIYFVGRRLYQVMVTGGEKAVKGETADSFLASFRATE
jgi:hypothetical protein